ncbi:zinc finger protein 271-like isoform X5 [Gadus chalcogrammus]|uniref:zinc finger protein 271-like isoform X5 n=1 Tax=Gadus chalcogrammus TaxID=1042646 RepID=UPI0024C3E528|nr:zinc finger protein 271-like isoform X5 [Gadus chalcogrammus]
MQHPFYILSMDQTQLAGVRFIPAPTCLAIRSTDFQTRKTTISVLGYVSSRQRSNFAASSVTGHTVLCEKHFTPDSYNQGDLMELRPGFRRRESVRLANGAVPSVHAGLPATSGGTESSTSRESARRKRELCTIVGESAASNDGAGATSTSEPEDDGVGDTSTMDPEPVVVHRGSQCKIRCFHSSLDDFGDCSTQRDATSESLYAPGSSHVSELEALNSLSADHSVVKSLERALQLPLREELTVQQTPDTISIKVEEDMDGAMPALEDCDDFGDCSTQHSAALDSLHVDAPGSSHMSGHKGELRILNVYGKGEGPLVLDGNDTLFTASKLETLNSLSADHREELTVQQTPDTISIKEEEDIDWGMHAGEDCDDFGDCSTQRGAALDSLHVDTPGSSHMSSHKGELRILNVYGKGEGPLAVDGHDTLFTACKLEAQDSLSADHSVVKSLESGEQLVHREELTRHRGGGKGRPCVLSVEGFPEKTNMSTRSGEKPYGCDQCKKRFQLKGNLKIHMRTHSREKPYRCDQCVKRFSLSFNLKVHMRTHSGEKPYKCNQCVMCFGHSASLKSHMRTHSGEKPYRCNQCVKRFSKSYNLKIHMRIHSGEKPYRCDQCMKCFSKSYNLKIHMRTHSGEKPNKCNQCMKCFSHSSDLKVHIRTHSGEKPYRCDQCVKRFSHSTDLKIHMRTHSREKPYRCDQCVKRFSHSTDLKSHMRTHSGLKSYGCDQCVKRFGQSSHLKSHMRIHSGEKPYRCDQCVMCFSQSSGLKRHMRIHSGEKPYRCDQCVKRFNQCSALKRHKRTCSGEKP